MFSIVSNFGEKSHKNLPPFCKEKYIAYINEDKWRPTDQFSYDHLTPEELNSLADQIASFSSVLVEERDTILKDDYPRLLKSLDIEVPDDLLLEDANNIFLGAADQLETYATMMFNDAFYVRREIVLREWDIVSQRLHLVKKVFLENKRDGEL